jgi:hypothetical protein
VDDCILAGGYRMAAGSSAGSLCISAGSLLMHDAFRPVAVGRRGVPCDVSG